MKYNQPMNLLALFTELLKLNSILPCAFNLFDFKHLHYTKIKIKVPTWKDQTCTSIFKLQILRFYQKIMLQPSS